jgi:2-polyprenyl-6-methoxyphenol hydroxylase-like FAD-dependent oxidoreductase
VSCNFFFSFLVWDEMGLGCWIEWIWLDLADGMMNRLHYECGICERRNFLKSLYEQLGDKSKILLNKKVIAVELLDEGVRVRCEDGSVFEGSIVVGADGIHSRVRKEMQRLAPQGLMDRDLKSKLLA